jgi:hypothetical protein
MSEPNQKEYCTHCKSVIDHRFCSNCGQPVVQKRINGKYVLSEIGSVLNFERGILYTIKELLIRPGTNIRKFILGDRNRLVKPIIFLIICSLVYTIAQQLFHFEDGYVNYQQSGDSVKLQLFEWVQSN